MKSRTPCLTIPAPPPPAAQPNSPYIVHPRDLYAISPALNPSGHPSGHHFAEPGFLGQTTSAWAESPVDLASAVALENEDVVMEQAKLGETKLGEAKLGEAKPGFRFRVGRKTRKRSTRRTKVAPAKEGGEGGKQTGKVSAWTFLCFKTSRRAKKENGRTWSSIIDPADFQVYAMALTQEQEHTLRHLPAPSLVPPPAPMAYSPLRTSSTGSTQMSIISARDESMRRLEGKKVVISSWMDPDESETWGVHAW